MEKTVWRFLRNLKIELAYDVAVSLLGVYTYKTIIQKDTYTSMFITALFKVKNRETTKYPLTYECIRKMWYGFTMEYNLTHEKK